MQKERNYEKELEAALGIELDSEEDFIDMSALDDVAEKNEFKNNAKDKKNIVCKTCNKQDIHYQDGRFPNGGKRWRDSSGSISNGRMCASCNRERAKVTMTNVRLKRGYQND